MEIAKEGGISRNGNTIIITHAACHLSVNRLDAVKQPKVTIFRRAVSNYRVER